MSRRKKSKAKQNRARTARQQPVKPSAPYKKKTAIAAPVYQMKEEEAPNWRKVRAGLKIIFVSVLLMSLWTGFVAFLYNFGLSQAEAVQKPKPDQQSIQQWWHFASGLLETPTVLLGISVFVGLFLCCEAPSQSRLRPLAVCCSLCIVLMFLLYWFIIQIAGQNPASAGVLGIVLGVAVVVGIVLLHLFQCGIALYFKNKRLAKFWLFYFVVSVALIGLVIGTAEVNPTESLETATQAPRVNLLMLSIVAFLIPVGFLFLMVKSDQTIKIAQNNIQKQKKADDEEPANGVAHRSSKWKYAFVLAPMVLIFVLGTAWSYYVRYEARMTQLAESRMKLIIIGGFHGGFGQLEHDIYCRDGKALLSWRVALLPRLGHAELYRQFRLDEPWDSPHNKTLISKMPDVYAHPRAPSAAAKGLTHFQVFVSEPDEWPHAIFVRSHNRKYRTSLPKLAAQDGTSNTILVVEATTPVPWTKPADIRYSKSQTRPQLGVSGSFFLAGLADGHVRQVAKSISNETLNNAICLNDSRVLGADW